MIYRCAFSCHLICQFKFKMVCKAYKRHQCHEYLGHDAIGACVAIIREQYVEILGGVTHQMRNTSTFPRGGAFALLKFRLADETHRPKQLL